MAELLLAAADFVAPDRIEHLARGWLARAELGQSDPDREAWQVAAAFGMAMNLALFSPSVNGATAFDRMARARRQSEPSETAVLAALRRAQFRLLRIETIGKDGTTQLRDLASEAVLVVLDEIPPDAAGIALAAYVIPWGDDRHLFAGGITPLDHAALAVAMGFVRAGARRGLINPQRCAEAVYRHVIRHGTLEIPGLNRPPEGLDDELLDEGGELDQLAQRWAKPDAAHDPEDIQFVRDQASLDTVLALLASVAATREHGLGALSGAYAAIMLVQLETLHRRAMAGSGAIDLATVAAAVDTAITAGDIPPDTRAVFNDLRSRLGAAPSAESARDADLDRMIGRIQALRAKTVEQGCTEEEAFAAAEKVAELLDRYGLSLSELDLQQQACEGASVETERKRVGPVDDCVPAVAAFFDCRVWSEKASSGRLRYVFFGLPADVAAARYLYDLVEQAFETETAQFRAGSSYIGAPSGERRALTTSFQIGLGQGITAKLHSLRATREATLRTSSGRDLVVVKADIVDEELAKLGLQFRSRARSSGRRVIRDAFKAGHEAGLGFEYTLGVKHQND